MTTATAKYLADPLTLVGTERMTADRGTTGVTGGTITQDIANLSGAPAVSVEFSTDADITLTQAQYQAESITFTDSPTTLTAGRSVVFPAHFPTKYVKNSTAQTLTLKKSGQTGVTLAAGADAIVSSGASDVVKPSTTGSTQGKHAIPIMAGSMTPSASGGCATLATIATSANHPDIQTLDFDATTEEYAQFAVPMPKSWNEGTITAMVKWSHASTATNFGTVWGIQAVAVSDGDSIDVAYGTAQTVTDTGGTANTLYATAETSAITVAGSPAASDTVYFRVYRKAADASDTLAVDARLHSVVLFITTDADTDL